MFEILERKELGPKMILMKIRAKIISEKASPGQFIIIRLDDKGERIPLTIADYERDKGTITVVFQQIGKTTNKLSLKKIGDKIHDVLGPLGTPSELDNIKKVICVGGGIGVAPIYPMARKLKEQGCDVTTIIGYRAKNYVFWEEKLGSVSNKILIATNDGSYGEKGFVTDILKRELENSGKIDEVIAIGPAIMMKAVADLTKVYDVKTVVSLNSLMLCGMGMCGVCRVTVGGETKFTCSDGPDFDAHKVDFEGLMNRLNTYKEEEKISYEKWLEEVKYYGDN